MKNAKPWHWVVIAAAVLATVYTVYRSLTGERVSLTNRITLVDISTGELFEAKTGRISAIIPEKNPDTGSFTLFPVTKDDKGQWRIAARYLTGLDPSTPASALVSPKTGEVKVKSESARQITLGK